MGQRHQVFIKILNLDNGENSKEFGKEKTTVLAYHHQWLYGKSPLIAAHNILSISSSHEYNNPFHKKYCYKNIPQQKLVDITTNILSIFSSPQAKLVGRNGYENFLYLNKDEPNMREDFTIGDNNDGVLIIDTIENKYCFININEHYKSNNSAYSLIPMTPCSAEEYLLAYYPEKSNYNREDPLTEKEIEEMQDNTEKNINTNKPFKEMLKDFTVMTLEEVKIMFPKSFQNAEQNV